MRLQGQGAKPKHGGQGCLKVGKKVYFKCHKICYLGLSEDKPRKEWSKNPSLTYVCYFSNLKWPNPKGRADTTTTCGKGERSIKNKAFRSLL